MHATTHQAGQSKRPQLRAGQRDGCLVYDPVALRLVVALDDLEAVALRLAV